MRIRPRQLLARHVVLRTHDPAEFHSYIAGLVGDHGRQVTAKGPVSIELRHASLGRVDVGLQYTNVPITVDSRLASSDGFILQFPITGNMDLTIDGRSFHIGLDAGAVISPGHRVQRHGGPGWTLALQAQGDFVRARLVARLRRPVRGPLVFHPRIGAQATELLSYVLLMVEAIDRGVAVPGSSVAGVLEEGLINLLIEIQPHSQGRSVSGTDLTARAARVRAVSDHVDRRLAEPLTMDDLATAAGCSVRSLQATFAEFCGLAPMEWVRRHRLTAARRLLESDTAEKTVSDIALRTGFTHMARFAARYRARYGESPSDTLRRSGRKRDDSRRNQAGR